jgi:hypothetical protein
MSRPSSRYEHRLRDTHGYNKIAGVDEVGCGCLAGPVVAAVVILPSPARSLGFMAVKVLQVLQKSLSFSLENQDCKLLPTFQIALAWSLNLI